MTALYTVLRSMVIASAAGSVAALLLWGLLFCVRRVSLRWQYRLWVSAAALFLLPVRFVWRTTADTAPFHTVTVYIAETAARPLPPPTAAVPQLAWGDVAAIVWLVTAVCMLVYYIISYVVQVRRLRRATRPMLCAQLAEYTARRVRVRTGEGVTSPMLLGLWHPTLYLPDRPFDGARLQHILAHETVHLHRGDLWIKRLCLLIRCVHWFNPAAHAVCRRVATVCETSCDTAAIERCGGDTAGYLQTVLSLLCESARVASLSTAMAGSPQRIKARFRAVSEHAPRRGVTVTAVIVAMVLLAGTLCAGGVFAGRTSVPLESPVIPSAPSFDAAEKSTETAPPAEEEVQNGLRWPLLQTKGTLSATYGYRWGNLHRGIDMAADLLEPVVAAADGKVVACEAADYNGGYGKTVLIDHGNGMQTLYAHLEDVSVTEGGFVTAGQTIARVGMTGVVTGPCLHFEVRVNDVSVDPLEYLSVMVDESAADILVGEKERHDGLE